jgi:hypothetical protein
MDEVKAIAGRGTWRAPIRNLLHIGRDLGCTRNVWTLFQESNAFVEHAAVPVSGEDVDAICVRTNASAVLRKKSCRKEAA